MTGKCWLEKINGKWVSWAHTVVAYAAFIGALIVGCWLHYHKIVQNEHYGYPDEWFPSVSATIGDRYPERSVFMIFIAITSGPRFMLVFLWYVLTARPNATLPKVVVGIGLFRTITCGGWTYVTSTDDHDWHDIFMISYLVATLPWTLGCLALSPNNRKAFRYRKILASLFFGTLVPLIYFFIQHKVHKVAGGKWSTPLISIHKTDEYSLYNLRVLRVVFDTIWCWIWRCYCTWFRGLRADCERCQGRCSRVCSLASEIDQSRNGYLQRKNEILMAPYSVEQAWPRILFSRSMSINY